MADTGYGCVFGDCTAQPAHIITDLSNGASVSLCAEHYAPGLIPLLAAELGVEPGPFYGHIERYLTRQAKAAEKELAAAQKAEQAQDGSTPIPGSMGTGQVADDDAESLVFADESEYAGSDGDA